MRSQWGRYNLPRSLTIVNPQASPSGTPPRCSAPSPATCPKTWRWTVARPLCQRPRWMLGGPVIEDWTKKKQDQVDLEISNDVFIWFYIYIYIYEFQYIFIWCLNHMIYPWFYMISFFDSRWRKHMVQWSSNHPRIGRKMRTNLRTHEDWFRKKGIVHDLPLSKRWSIYKLCNEKKKRPQRAFLYGFNWGPVI